MNSEHIVDMYPLSPLQQGILYHTLAAPRSGVYVNQSICTLHGELDVPCFRRAWECVIDRHPILRTAFVWDETEEPVQVVCQHSTVTLEQLDWRGLTRAQQSERLEQLIDEQRSRGFDLCEAPIMSLCLIRTASHIHQFVWTYHHILLDGWSLPLLIKEVFLSYEALANQREIELPPCRPYRDYIAWLGRQDTSAAEVYWRKALEGFTEPTRLVIDKCPSNLSSPEGPKKIHRCHLTESVTAQLRDLAQRHQITVNTVVHGAVSLLLSQYSGSHDVVVGAVVSGRPPGLPGVESMVGLFINTAPVRTQIRPDSTVIGWMKELHAQQSELRHYEYCPLTKIQHWSETPRGKPLFETLYVFENYPTEAIASNQSASLEIRDYRAIEKTNYPLVFVVGPSRRLSLTIGFTPHRYDEIEIQAMSAHLRRLLETIVVGSKTRISDLPRADNSISRQGSTRVPNIGVGADLLGRSNLTKNQLLMWVDQQSKPNLPLYNMVHVFTIARAIDPTHFQHALQTLINSSDALRAVFYEDEQSIPRQEVLATLSYQVPYLDFSSASNARAKMANWARERSQSVIDLKDRCFDTALIKLSHETTAWIWRQHHITGDAWSTGIVFRLMSELYERSVRRQLDDAVALPEFHDYVRDESEYRQSVAYRNDQAYWMRKARQQVDPLRFFGCASNVKSTRVERVTCSLGAERTRRLRAIANQEQFFVKTENVSLFNIFVALLCTYLHRICGSRRLAIGAAFHNRRQQRHRETIGVFMEVHPLYVSIDEDDTFVTLAKKASDEASAAIRHSRCATGNPAGKKMYEVFVNYQTASFTSFAGSPIQHESIHPGHENDVLQLQIQDFAGAGEMLLQFTMHCDVFDVHKRLQLPRQFNRLVDGFLKDFTQSIHRVGLTTVEELRTLCGQSVGATKYPHSDSVIELFAEQVRRLPDKPAVVANDHIFTYGELHEHSDRLAGLIAALNT